MSRFTGKVVVVTGPAAASGETPMARELEQGFGRIYTVDGGPMA
jgi:hypothetical protein